MGLVERLTAQDLVMREPGEVARREVYISLMPQGNDILAQLSAAHRQELRRIGPQLYLLLEHLAGEDTLSAD